jgi:hypothetical protein
VPKSAKIGKNVERENKAISEGYDDLRRLGNPNILTSNQ